MGMQNPEWTNTVATIVPYSFEMLSRWSSRYVAKTLMLPLLCFMSCSVVTIYLYNFVEVQLNCKLQFFTCQI